MSEKFNLEIIRPDKTAYKSEVEEVVIPSFEGLMTVLKDHIALVTFLRPGFIEIRNSNSKNKFFVEDGIVEFSNNQLLILTASAIKIEDLHSEKILKMIKDAELKNEDKKISDKKKYILSHKLDSLREINQ